jgi:hypothetical protein
MVNNTWILKQLNHYIGKALELLRPEEIFRDIIEPIVLPTYSAYFPGYEHVTVKSGS